MKLEALELCTGANPSASVILMHGLGASGEDFEPIVEELALPQVRFIFPHAPLQAVTISGGYVMRAWYDLLGLEMNSPQDEKGIRITQGLIEALIEQEQQRGIAAQNIILAGFSQGGAIALHTALRQTQRLGGVLALSTYLPLKDHLAAEAATANREIPIFMAHGRFDNVIRMPVAEASANFLREHGYQISWHDYPMAHSVCAQELIDIRSFLVQCLKLTH